MAKYYGKIGFAKLVEKEGSITEEQIVEKTYYGDVIRHGMSYNPSGEKLLDDIRLTDEISIVADHFAMENSYLMRYVTYLGAKWKIASFSVAYPRIIITFGGVYNGPEETETP